MCSTKYHCVTRISQRNKGDHITGLGNVIYRKLPLLYVPKINGRYLQIPYTHYFPSSQPCSQFPLHLWYPKRENKYVWINQSTKKEYIDGNFQLKSWRVPKLIALKKMVNASTKMMMDARPKIAIIFLTTCWPVNAAMVATKIK